MNQLPRQIFTIALGIGLALGASPLAAQSQYGCTGLELHDTVPSLEGKDGVFFRVNLDIRMHHPFSDESVAFLSDFSDALAESGTTLVFVPVPTKSVTMPDHLPEEAALYGFDLDVATAVHDDILNRLEAAGVATVDARAAMRQAPEGELPFFKADFHWSAVGARETARAVAERIKALPLYDELPKTTFETNETGVSVAFSGMRRELQEHCLETLPEAESMTYETTIVQSGGQDGTVDLGLGTVDLGLGGDSGGGIDIFGNTEESTVPIALLGTSFSATDINNFSGFIAEFTEVELVNYALTGGNQFGAMISYLTSAEFRETRPRVLIWENPIYTNLAQFGDQPTRELVAAAGQTCTLPLDPVVSEDRQVMNVDLSGYDFGPEDTLFVDLNQLAGSEAVFRFHSSEGYTRTKVIERGERLKRTGRFYMPLSGLWDDGAVSVDITSSLPFTNQPSVFACTTQPTEKT
ncbi:hypothetical protein [Yoonia sp. BS5-3]|uniref:AlgX/AlgJ SGNH hydrolase-like domain-containing protein n=1 Tax=Yoonia phaeophyticola TaxID=3137369 RepID=A0ABZ2V8D9_9RHOB